jgi:hypothetical protein
VKTKSVERLEQIWPHPQASSTSSKEPTCFIGRFTILVARIVRHFHWRTRSAGRCLQPNGVIDHKWQKGGH